MKIKNRVRLCVLLMLLVLAVFPVTAQAKWVKSGSSYVWQTTDGKTYASTYYTNAKLGFAKIGNETYVYQQNGKKKTGRISKRSQSNCRSQLCHRNRSYPSRDSGCYRDSRQLNTFLKCLVHKGNCSYARIQHIAILAPHQR